MRAGAVIRAWRVLRERTLRDVAKEIGISPSTLMRFEVGRQVDAAALARLLTWLMASDVAAVHEPTTKPPRNEPAGASA